MKLSPRQREALALVADGKFVPCLVKEDDGWCARWRALGDDANPWVDEYVREFTMTRLTEDAEEQKHETLHDAWIAALSSRTGRVAWDEAECAEFAAELAVWGGDAEEDRAARREIVFKFNCSGKAEFAVSCDVPKGRRMLKELGRAAYVWPPLVGLKALRLKSKVLLSLSLSHSEAENFIRHAARELRDAGYGVEGVDIAAAITASAEITTNDSNHRTIEHPNNFKLVVRVAGEPVTAEEIRFLLDQGSSLVCFRDHWIEVDRGILKEALRALEKGVGKKANPLSFALGLGHVGRLEIEEAKAHGWLRGLVEELKSASSTAGDGASLGPIGGDLKVDGLVGELRDYQKRGVEWLQFLTGHGFGALLADDMGLGKTVQIIAWILKERLKGVLVVAPLTLLGNWSHEFARFAPDIKVYVHQGEMRHLASGFKRAVAENDVTLTSYSLLVKDYTEISEVAWEALVLDEAQAIKNPDTQVARAACALLPPRRVAMTGTPVENSVADLWSLEEFLNPGLLGERMSFVERFVRPIAADERSTAAKRLRHALEPFVLRRLKSDGRIAAELGEKREVREYCALSDEQRRDYETALAEFRAHDHAQGDVFALLTRLKLVCDGAGKFERLCELVGAILENGESALVFTQYAKVGQRLLTGLEERFGRRFPFLHGSLSPAEREQQVESFVESRRPNVFILSLKAGGFGLNLTKATHVIHYDRWWNPAVEGQATDRAHRIGQRKTVFVHLFITEGTVEEHVDDIMRRKARVADTVITEAEWLEAVKLEGV